MYCKTNNEIYEACIYATNRAPIDTVKLEKNKTMAEHVVGTIPYIYNRTCSWHHTIYI